MTVSGASDSNGHTRQPLAPASGMQQVILSAEAPGTGGGRLSAVVAWLRGRTETSLGRLALLRFHRYFEASRNSGAHRPPTLSVTPC